MDSAILNQLNNIEKEVNSEVTKSKRGRKKKTDTKINKEEDNNIIEKRDRLITCVLSGNSKQYLGKEYTEQQINEMDGNNINILSNRYESVLSRDLECDPFLNTAMQRSTCDLYYCFGAFLAPVQ